MTELFVHWARKCGELGLVRCSSGNLSHRAPDNVMLISGTGSWLTEMTTDQVARVDIINNEPLNLIKPSAEYKLHREIYLKRPEISTILHFQSPSATTLACMDVRPDYNVIIEIPIYIGKIGYLPFIQPGSESLAKEAGDLMRSVNLIQMTNHGQVVCGKGFGETIQKAVFFELACSILLKSGFRASPISAEHLTNLEKYAVNTAE